MDTRTFERYANWTAHYISEYNPEVGKLAEEWVAAVVAQREGRGTAEATRAVMDRLPPSSTVSTGVASMIASLTTLIFAYELG